MAAESAAPQSAPVDAAAIRAVRWPEEVAKAAGLRYDMLINVFDRSIIEVENRVYGDSMRRHLLAALEKSFLALPETQSKRAAVEAPIKIGRAHV